ncbi:hypothetical protein LPB136_05150 [Tenacibaculum todarodis]|uniref:DUF1573 domain-containing protein n=1 Tax=Tenacibaculum todarodis TaxID=1850252 RepID=A0A1L3JI25_9FLAO|nr:DUF1573 domain-containing protein [Tenacibaculum todarodis]APG64785.1 hypothetical protein LPB136_05150 [Tenacibaculum todarodis]
MNKGLLLGLGLLFSVGVSAQEFQFEKETINYGKVAKGSDGKRIFEFTNIGDAPLIIEDIKTSCDCAVPESPKRPIMPGEKSTLTVEYDTSKTGGFSKTITIFSNAKSEIKKIKVKGYISK